MKEEKSEKQIKAVEPKSSFFKSEPKVEKHEALISKKALKFSSPRGSWSVECGQDVSGLSSDKLKILKDHGCI